jgi:uncharacterized repeat protein (TIGR01451 family)
MWLSLGLCSFLAIELNLSLLIPLSVLLSKLTMKYLFKYLKNISSFRVEQKVLAQKKETYQNVIWNNSNIFPIFRGVMLTMLLTVPEFVLVSKLFEKQVLAQTNPQTNQQAVGICPVGTAPVTLDWDNSNYPPGSFNQSFNIGGVQASFEFTESVPGFISDESPPRPLGPIPIGTDAPPYGGLNERFLRWGIDNRRGGPGDNSTLTITFSQPVILPSPLNFFDVDTRRDDEQPFQDQITVTAFNNNSPVGVTLTPVNPSFVGIVGNTARGIGSNASPNSNDANVRATFSSPVNRIVTVYQGGSDVAKAGQDETIGLGDITICVATITGTLYEDGNGDDNFNPGEPTLPAGISVKLIDENGNVVQTTTTNSNGQYTFTGPSRGNYRIQVDTSDSDIPNVLTLGTPNNLQINFVGTPITDQNFGFDRQKVGTGNAPNIRLVKRITNVFREGRAVTDFNFSSFVDDPSDEDDNILTSSSIQPIGVPRIETPLRSGDEVEYTIYYLSDGNAPVENITFCDNVPQETTYSNDSFGAETGILVNQAGGVNSLRNAGDSRGRFYRPLEPLPSNNPCINPNNPNGSVLVNLGNISNAADANFGFVRFRVRIN